MTYLELPSGYGFPHIVRIPLGLTPYPVANTSFLHSTPLPSWIATDSVPPGGVSDPTGTWRATEKVLKQIARAAALWGPF